MAQTDMASADREDLDEILKVEMQRDYDAPRVRVFDALTIPEQVAQWWGPAVNMVDGAEVEARVGGRYIVTMSGENGEDFSMRGEIVELLPPERLVIRFTRVFDDGSRRSTLLTLTLEEQGAGTCLTLLHEGFANLELRDGFSGGWAHSLEHLAQLLAA